MHWQNTLETCLFCLWVQSMNINKIVSTPPIDWLLSFKLSWTTVRLYSRLPFSVVTFTTRICSAACVTGIVLVWSYFFIFWSWFRWNRGRSGYFSEKFWFWLFLKFRGNENFVRKNTIGTIIGTSVFLQLLSGFSKSFGQKFSELFLNFRVTLVKRSL